MSPAERVAKALAGRRKAGGGFMARCPCHDDKRPSLSLDAGEGGRLLVRCFAGCDSADVLAELRRRGLLAGNKGNRPSNKTPKKRETGQGGQTARALAIWRASGPISGTLPETYLRRRGITMTLPPSLRFHPALDYFDGAAEPGAAITLPALVAGVQTSDRRLVAVHRTFLRPDGTGKASVSTPKKMLGPCTGGAVRFAPAGSRLLIGEGLESTLAAMQATGIPSWSALSTSGLRALILPPVVRDVVIAADGDTPGIEAAQAATDRWTSEGRTVRIAHAPEGFDFADVIAGQCPATKEARDAR